jgi:ligand-binding SRPBCC domain-containing protein
MPTIVLTTAIRATPDACFAASLSVEAHTASMGDSGERAVAGRTTGVLGPGDTVTWRARHFGLPFRMTARISVHEAPHRFVDEQVSGPFRSWWHEHRFAATPDGTSMTDTVRYTSPAGPLGRLVDRLVLVRYLTRLLEARNRWLAAELSRGRGDAGAAG